MYICVRVCQLFVDFKKAYDSVMREVLYNILTEFGVTKELVRLVKMCLNETYSIVRVGKNLSDRFPIRNGLKQGDALSPFVAPCCGTEEHINVNKVIYSLMNASQSKILINRFAQHFSNWLMFFVTLYID